MRVVAPKLEAVVILLLLSLALPAAVSAAITLAPTTVPNWTVSKAGYSQALTATGGTAGYTYVISTGTLPTGITLSTAGLLSGTPSATGTSTFTVKATDSTTAFGTQQYTLIVNAAPAISTVSPLTAWTANATGYSVALAATGGTTPFSYAVTTGTLPAGLTLGTTGTISGTPTAAATSNFTVTLTDAAAATNAKALAITINAAVTVSPATLPAWTLGKAYSQTVTSANGTGTRTLSLSSGSLPPGLTFTAGTGAIAGTPTTAGTYPFAITATDSVGGTGLVNYSVVINPAITLSPTTLPNWTATKTGYSQTITAANGTGTKTLAVTSGAVPTGMAFTVASGLLNGTPTTAGTFTFSITATDTAAATTVQPYTIIIAAAPTITTASPLATWTANTAYSSTVVGTGGTAPISYGITAGALPDGLVLGTTGTISGTPTSVGTANFTITLTDAVATTNAKAFAMTINPVVNMSPSTMPNWTAGKAGYSQTVVTSGGTGARTLSLSAGAVPTGLTFTVASGVLAGTPTTAGTYNFTITATDTVGATVATPYTVVINPALTFTTTTLPGWTVSKSGYSQSLAVTGGTGSDTFALTAGALPGGITLNSAGLLSGTPAATGTFNFTVTATDSLGTTGAKALSIIISAAPTVTTATVPTPWTAGKGGYSATLAASGGTTPYSFAVSAGALPDGLSLSTAGALTGAPTTQGSSAFTVTVTDAAGATASKAYAVVVNAAIAITVPSVPDWTQGKSGYTKTITATGGTGALTFTVTSGALPAGLTLTTAGVLAGTPTAAGPFAFTITATDTIGATASQAYTMTVGAAIVITPASLPGWTQNLAGYTQTIGTTGGTGAVTFTVTAGALPGGLTLATGGLLSGTPTAAGSFTFTVTAKDTVSATATQSYTVIIGAAVTVSPGTLPAWTIGRAGYSQTITSAGGTGARTLSLTAGAVPDGMSFAAATGVLTGTPTTAGSFGFTITATDSQGATGSMAYTVVINPAIAIATTALPNWTLSKTGYSQALAQSGGTGAATYAVTSGALPGGLSLSTAGVLSGTPSATGSFTFSITATDTAGSTASQSYTVVINPVVAVNAATLPVWTQNKPGYSQALTGTGGTGTLSFTVTSGAIPAGLTLTTAGLLSGTPTGSGTASFTVTATDAVGATASKAFSIVVNPAVTILTVRLPNSTINKTGYAQTIGVTGGTGTVTFSVSAGALPDGLSMTSAGRLTGTPTVAGTFTPTITCTDTLGATGSKTYTVVIAPAVTITTTTLPAWTVSKAYSQALQTSGGTGALRLAITTGSLPTGMSLSTAGVLSGTPTTAGTFNFTVLATDTVNATGTQALSVVIDPAVTVTAITLPNWTLNQPGYSQTLTGANGTGAITLSVSAGALPTGLTFDSGTGKISGTPAVRGPFSFTITGTDTVGATGSRAFSVFINNIVTVTTASLPLWPSAKPGYSATVAATGGTGALTFSLTNGSLPTGLNLAATGALTGTPDAGTANSYPITITATDTTGATGSKDYTLVITIPKPTLTTPTATAITGTGATLGASLVSDGGSTISDFGIVIAPTASAGNLTTPGGSGVTTVHGTGAGAQGVFGVSVASLIPGVPYSFAGYATNGVGTSYSEVGAFTTLNNDARLAALTVTTGSLAPIFSSGTTSYGVSVANDITSAAVTPTLSDVHASVAVNGGDTVSGHASDTFPLIVGSNNLLVTVTAEDRTTRNTYVVAVTRVNSFITLQQGAVSLANSASTASLGSSGVNKPASVSFTMKNISGAALTGFQFNVDGANPTDFTVVPPTSATLGANASASFSITFQPGDMGPRAGALHITATGQTTNPFNIGLTGTGVAVPTVVTSPASRMVALGQPVSFSVSANGGNLSYQWLKNNVAIRAGTGTSFAIAATALTDAAAYSVKVTNAAGSITSAVASLGVVKTAPASVSLINGATLSLAASAAGPGVSYQWKKSGTDMNNGLNPANSTGVISGATTTKLGVTKIAGADADTYTCNVSMTDPQNVGTPMSLFSGAFTVHVISKPVLDTTFVPGPWTVGAPVSDVITAQNIPVSFALAGQPAGVTLDAGGHFHGKPLVAISVPTLYHLTISASNAAGACLVPLKVNVTVNPLPATAVGVFNGLVDRDDNLSAGYGGTLSVTSLTTSAFTGKLTLGALSYSFVSQQLANAPPANPTGTVTIARKAPLNSLTLNFSIDATTGKLTGTLSDGVSPPVNCTAWHNPWNATTNKCPLAATYTSELELDPAHVGDPAIPQGTGFGTLIVSTAGAASWTGKMADGVVTTATVTAGPGGQVPLHFMLYTNTGSAHGWAAATADDPTTPTNNHLLLLDGGIDWLKNPAPATNKTDRTYRTGITLNALTLIGGQYVKPVNARVLGLAATTNNATLTFSGANLEAALTYQNTAGTGPTASLDGKVFTITATNTVTMPAGLVNNPATLALTLNATTGAFSGTFLLKSDPDPTKTGAVISRSTAYYGLLVPRVSINQGLGFFLLAQLPDPGPPVTTAATSPVLSGQVELGAAR